MSETTIGKLNPSLAKRLGLDEVQSTELAHEVDRWEGRIFPVTFTAPHPRADGKRDPIAYLPPDYRGFGIVDKAYRDRVAVGESWLVEVAPTEGTGARFLVPLTRIDLKGFLELQPSLLSTIVDHLARQSPMLAKELSAKLPAPPNPDFERRLAEANQTIRTLESQVSQLQKDRAALETKVDELNARETPKLLPLSSLPSAVEERTDGPSEVSFDGLGASPIDASPGQLVRSSGDVVESTRLVHSAYEVYFTPDLFRLYLRPSKAGTPCERGRLIIHGLAEVDTTPAPTSYPMLWDSRQGAFSVYLGDQSGRPRSRR